VVKLAPLSTQASFDTSKAFPIGQLRKHHDEVLIETIETSDTPIAVVMLNTATKTMHGKVVDYLGKYEFANEHNLPLESLKKS